MQLHFIKMHGVGNDFVIFEPQAGQSVPKSETLRELANRRTGIGFDQVLILEPPRQEGSDIFYRIFNADGVEVEQCGNGARCIARLLFERHGKKNAELAMDSPGGLVRARVLEDGQVSVNMGMPVFDPASLPFNVSSEAHVYPLEVAGSALEIGAVSIGNAHAVVTVASVDTAPVDRIGPALENHPAFPRRTNVGFMEIIDPGHIRLRVHERGTGETRACGTGACAAVAVGRKHGKLDDSVMVELPGGELQVNWAGPGESIWLTGPATKVYEGTLEL
jgi:diaminopimelate epimerase